MCTLTLSMHDVQDKKHSELYLGRMRLLRKSRGVLRICVLVAFFFFSSRRRHTRYWRDWSSDVCSSDLRHWRGRFQPVAAILWKPSARRYMSPSSPCLASYATTLHQGAQPGLLTEPWQIGRASCRERV